MVVTREKTRHLKKSVQHAACHLAGVQQMDLLFLPVILCRNDGLALSFCCSYFRSHNINVLFAVLQPQSLIYQIKLRLGNKMAPNSIYFWCEEIFPYVHCGDFKFWALDVWLHWIITWLRAKLAGTLSHYFLHTNIKKLPFKGLTQIFHANPQLSLFCWSWLPLELHVLK